MIQNIAMQILIAASIILYKITQRLLKIILMNLISMDLQKNTRIFFRQSMTYKCGREKPVFELCTEYLRLF